MWCNGSLLTHLADEGDLGYCVLDPAGTVDVPGLGNVSYSVDMLYSRIIFSCKKRKKKVPVWVFPVWIHRHLFAHAY